MPLEINKTTQLTDNIEDTRKDVQQVPMHQLHADIPIPLNMKLQMYKCRHRITLREALIQILEDFFDSAPQ